MKTYTYEEALSTSQRVDWKLDDVIGGDRRLDFAHPFLPESLARVQGLDFLDAHEKRVLNQVRGHAYLCIFGLVEEFILPFVLDHARPQLSGDDWRVRALLQFAQEEAKHIHLFKRFRATFERGFGHRCEVIGPPEEIARAVLAHDPLGVALAILQIEWMTQRHFVDSVRDDQTLDPLFKSLLRHHWMEEAQHAKIDGLMVTALAAGRTEAEKTRGFDDYLAIGAFLDAGLQQQVELDLAAFSRASGRRLAADELERLRVVQLGANRWTYLGSGMTHPRFKESVDELGARARLEAIAPAFC